MDSTPFLDLRAQYQKLRTEILQEINEVLDSSAYVLGPWVDEFEKSFARYCGIKYAIGCSSGTSALHLALRSLDIGPGDEVITVSHTFIATAWAISYCDAKPVFVDINPKTWTMDISQIESCLTSKTKAIIPVHLCGNPTEMDPILDIARRYGLIVIEDAAQAHGAKYRGKICGTIGDMGCFSFYPSKNLGAYGDAGAVVTSNPAYAERLRMLRDHAQTVKHYHDTIGYNYRMDGIQGAILAVKLRYLPEWIHSRRRIALHYNKELEGVRGIKTPFEAPGAKHVFHLYQIQLGEERLRNELQQFLNQNGIGTGLHYPIPIHLQKAYEHLGYYKGSLPHTERAAACNLSLPIYPELADEKVKFTCKQIRYFIEERTPR
jgi:dTDP-4-amino-4,6-dideoxygalactose transaminase